MENKIIVQSHDRKGKHPSDSIGNPPEMGKTAGQTGHIPAWSPQHTREREMLWERSMHSSFPRFFTSICKVLALLRRTPSCPPPKGNRKNQIEEPQHFPFPKSSPRPIFKYMNEATFRYSLSNSIYFPLKSKEVLPITRPSPSRHHCCGT